MRQRCLNPNATGYRYWGGRGVTIDPRWDSYENFYADLGERPAGTSLDRIDNDGNYQPGNCRWATRMEQAANQRPATHPRAKRTPRICLEGHRYSGPPGCPQCTTHVVVADSIIWAAT